MPARSGDRLGDLAMGGARVEVRVSAEGAGSRWRFALGANVGEAVLPLAKAASGGELARAMLAIRLVGLGGPQTMVFDEVDAGVGGAAALSLGAALSEVASEPAGAGGDPPGPGGGQGRPADQRAEAGGGRADRDLRRGRWTGEDRVVELSRMLSGHPDSDAARAHARELLGTGRTGAEDSGNDRPIHHRHDDCRLSWRGAPII